MLLPTHKMAAAMDLRFFSPELRGGPRFVSPPVFGGNKAHARTVAFVIAGGLARILERRVAAGAVPAGTHSSCRLGRDSRWAAPYPGRFPVL